MVDLPYRTLLWSADFHTWTPGLPWNRRNKGANVPPLEHEVTESVCSPLMFDRNDNICISMFCISRCDVWVKGVSYNFVITFATKIGCKSKKKIIDLDTISFYFDWFRYNKFLLQKWCQRWSLPPQWPKAYRSVVGYIDMILIHIIQNLMTFISSLNFANTTENIMPLGHQF